MHFDCRSPKGAYLTQLSPREPSKAGEVAGLCFTDKWQRLFAYERVVETSSRDLRKRLKMRC